MLERSRAEAESRLQQETQSLEQNNHTIQVTRCSMFMLYVRMYVHMRITVNRVILEI